MKKIIISSKSLMRLVSNAYCDGVQDEYVFVVEDKTLFIKGYENTKADVEAKMADCNKAISDKQMLNLLRLLRILTDQPIVIELDQFNTSIGISDILI